MTADVAEPCLPTAADEAGAATLPEEGSNAGTSVVPPLFVSSIFEEGCPQTLCIHGGQGWGVKVVPFKL